MLYKKSDYFEHLWQLQDTQKLACTYTSDLYTTKYQNQPAVLKIIKPESDEHHSPAILRYFDGKGAVKLFQYQDNALLLECLEPKPVLKSMVAEGQDDQATKIIASVIKELHSSRPTSFPTNTKTLKQHFRALFQKAEAEADSIYNRAAQIAEKLLSEEWNIRVLHGDIHHENILHSKRGWLAIDPKGIIGECTYEVANTLCNPDGLSNIVHSSERMQCQAGILASELNMDRSRILSFAYVHSCISICWSIEDGQDISYAMKSCEILENLVMS